MRPDDEIYMMVEDEFLSTAHLFTSHLHHAEYMRLKTLARDSSSSSARGNPFLLSRQQQQRPTDSITAMRAETLRKKQADAKAARNKAALEQMKQDARGGIDVSPSPDLSSPSESEEAKHPWAGTSLQGLMAPDARTQQKNLTSLRGMQGIKSSTRAAKGYGMGKAHAPPPRSNNPSPSFPSSSSSNTSSDLDAPLTRPKPTKQKQQKPPPFPSPPHQQSSSKPSNPPKNNNNPLTLAAEDLFHPTKPPLIGIKSQKPAPPTTNPPPPPRKFLDNEQQPTTTRRRVQARREREEKRRRREEDANNVNGNEMPVFLL
ncbi:MAG: hypothetical protein LQ344_002455 [Seirophora lacunosa]|nr:MAG: hypothetical protein LQ344_002455 [Seirophora lacunosa]